MNDQYFTEIDMDNHERYFKIPYRLIEDDYFSGLDPLAVMIYGILIDRVSLSQKNKQHFTDKYGHLYVIATNAEICNWIKKSEPVVIKLKRELIEHGLLKERRQGVRLANLLYPQKLRTKETLVQELKNVKGITKETLVQELKNVKSNQPNNIQPDITNLTEPEGAGDNYIDSIKDAPAENDLGIVHDWIFSEFGRYPTPFEIEDLKYFLQDHSKEVIKLAIKECVGNGKPYFKYLESILRDWKQKGLVTAELVENRQRPKRSSGKPSSELRLSDDGYNPRLGF
ncbi:TPA: DnaD domain protein [Streptococcus pneumoniae]|uniref:Putative prophage protein n=3 Tax=Streptococcus pneumoniae TaxID=1313 RepID=A0A098ANB4_STREE|nr:DnaD domain protein [Streptococcus pneumoniae]MDS2268462.1 DnaD domain protein [Streptococcus pneumoniae]MDS2340189.1 DnaD domain protein [Streptococcus pneumoniae]MDS2514099.1 DnaD domain protein [Streptococcus pneumoniae]MDS2908236.1 DnaD domain protein [Streptococcus pneumoniae]MDS2926219.1 DnaD domain protein [Streptococcus pneumoniae]